MVFLSPANLLATSLANSSVEVVWEESRGGWRAPSRQLRVEDEAMPGRRLLEREMGAGAGSVVLDGLQEEKTYILTFSPTGPRVPQDIGQVSTFQPSDMHSPAQPSFESAQLSTHKYRLSANPPKLMLQVAAVREGLQ